jgi:hypothetical protein
VCCAIIGAMQIPWSIARRRGTARLVVAGTLLWLATLDGAQPAARLLPVDEAATRPDFFSFRAALQEAVARHDVEAVMAVVHADIKASFGGDEGIESFRRMWQPDAPDSKLWGTMAAVLALGGTFQGEQTFVAPYTFSRWPDRFDAFEHVVLTAADVRIRDAPRTDAAVLATMSFAILPVAHPAQESEEWTAVRLEGKRVGYVASHFARSPIDYRAIFTLSQGRWRLTMFLAGD